jgi:hypothetical protein
MSAVCAVCGHEPATWRSVTHGLLCTVCAGPPPDGTVSLSVDITYRAGHEPLVVVGATEAPISQSTLDLMEAVAVSTRASLGQETP